MYGDRIVDGNFPLTKDDVDRHEKRKNKNMTRNADQQYQHFMELAQKDPEMAAQEFSRYLSAGKPSMKKKKALNQLEQIMSGDESAWQYGSSSLTDALQFLISNTIFGSMGMGVFRPGMESVVVDVANMISEDVDFARMTRLQKNLKTIAESYGFSVYVIQ